MILALKHLVLEEMGNAIRHHQGFFLALKAKDIIEGSEPHADRGVGGGKLLGKNINGKTAFV